MNNRKPSFFERLTGGMKLTPDESESIHPKHKNSLQNPLRALYEYSDDENDIVYETPSEQENVGFYDAHDVASTDETNNEPAELSVDVYYDDRTIYIQTMTAGVSKSDLDIIISREQVTITGTRERTPSSTRMEQTISELYWGSFERTVDLPDEIDIDRAEAHEINGLVTITLPKFDKEKKANLKIK